jgi:hypothetical protein
MPSQRAACYTRHDAVTAQLPARHGTGAGYRCEAAVTMRDDALRGGAKLHQTRGTKIYQARARAMIGCSYSRGCGAIVRDDIADTRQ